MNNNDSENEIEKEWLEYLASLTPEQKEVPIFLKEKVIGFKDSQQFKKHIPDTLLIPGVICGVFAKYLVGLEHRSEESPYTKKELSSAVKSCYEVIEAFSQNPSDVIQNYVVTEIFENLGCEKLLREKIKSKLLPHSKQLYDTYADWLDHGIPTFPKKKKEE